MKARPFSTFLKAIREPGDLFANIGFLFSDIGKIFASRNVFLECRESGEVETMDRALSRVT